MGEEDTQESRATQAEWTQQGESAGGGANDQGTWQ